MLYEYRCQGTEVKECVSSTGAIANKADANSFFSGEEGFGSSRTGRGALFYFLYARVINLHISFKLVDKFGNTPLLEALKNGHDRVASILVHCHWTLKIDAAGSFLCTVVETGDSDFLKRLMSNGIDPNSKDYDHLTPLHVANSEGLSLMTKLLLGAGASVLSKDRWGNTPLYEARMCGNNNLIKLLEEVKSTQLSEFPDTCETLVLSFHIEHRLNVTWNIYKD
ncbi:potassium channel SKOR-like [Actinidia eriantha]|uniref:potassium channel SKOR-like n=1 Tax=Actinidia eriantha TaxID=165200 RepID=UPI00258AA533|nr:potassium channel SKOR-like [Actinidia eriantha]